MTDDMIRAEDEAAVEASPAPPHPRSDSAAISREPTGGSPRLAGRDRIDDLVENSLKRGRASFRYDKCAYCDQPWHGLPLGKCPGNWKGVQ